MKKSNLFPEAYIIRYNYQKDDGYWVFSECTEISVLIEHGVNEKCNHDKAKQKFLNENKHLKNLTVKDVLYV